MVVESITAIAARGSLPQYPKHFNFIDGGSQQALPSGLVRGPSQRPFLTPQIDQDPPHFLPSWRPVAGSNTVLPTARPCREVLNITSYLFTIQGGSAKLLLPRPLGYFTSQSPNRNNQETNLGPLVCQRNIVAVPAIAPLTFDDNDMI